MEVVNRRNCKPFTTKDTSQVREIMSYRNSSCTYTSLAEATVRPGKSTEPHHHQQSEEIYYVLRGTARMRIDSQEREIGPGDAVLIRPGAVHQVRSTGRQDLVFLCICSPPYEHEDTVLERQAGRRDR